VSLKNNGIRDEHDHQILQLLGITKVTKVDLSCNEMEKLGGHVGRKLRDEVGHIQWIDVT